MSGPTDDNRPTWPPDYSMSKEDLKALVREEGHDRPLRALQAALARQLVGVQGLAPSRVTAILRRAAGLWPLHTGGRPGLSREEKLLVLRAIVAAAEKDGTPLEALTLVDAADYLDELCQRPQPIKIAGRRITLPASLEDEALDGPEASRRKVERLRQWIEDCFGTKSWGEAKRLLMTR